MNLVLSPNLLQFVAPSVVVLLLLVISVSFLRNYYLPAKKLERSLRQSHEAIAKIHALPDQERRSAAAGVLKHSVFAHNWSEYHETLHDQFDYGQVERTVTRSRATVPSSYFFSTQSIVDTPLQTEYFRHLPGIATGLGIIGTFAGLILGLFHFDPATPERVQESVAALIRDVSYAFVASFFAIVVAMVITHLEKKWLRRCYEHLEQLTDAIDHLFDAGVGEEYLSDLVRSSHESAIQTRMLKDSLVTDLREMLQNLVETQVRESAKLAEKLSVSYRESGGEMAAQIGQSIEASLREPLRKIADTVSMASGDQSQMVGNMLQDVLVAFMSKMEGTFGQQFQGMSAMLEKSVSSMESMQLGFAALVADMRQAGESSAQSASQHLTSTLQEMRSNQTLMQESLNEMIFKLQSAVEGIGEQGVAAGSKMAEQLAKMHAEGEARQQLMTNQMDEFVKAIQGAVGKSQQATSEQMAQTVEHIHQQMNELVDSVSKSIHLAQEEGVRNVSQSAASLNKEVSDLFATLEHSRTTMDASAQAVIKEFQDEAHAMLANLGTQVKQLLTLVGEERTAIAKTVEVLGAQTERNLIGMQTGSEKMRAAAERFEVAGGSVQTAIHAGGEMASLLKSSAGSVADSMRDMSAVVAEYRTSRDVTAANLRVLQDLVATAQEEAGLRQKNTADLVRLSDHIQKVNLETEEYLRQVAAVMGRSFDEFGSGVERTLVKTLGSFDAELDKAVKSLAGGVESVAENIDDLSEVLSRAVAAHQE